MRPVQLEISKGVWGPETCGIEFLLLVLVLETPWEIEDEDENEEEDDQSFTSPSAKF